MNEETAKIIQHSIYINAEDTVTDLRDGGIVSFSKNTILNGTTQPNEPNLESPATNDPNAEELKKDMLSVRGFHNQDRGLIELSFSMSSDDKISNITRDLFNSSIRKMIKDAELIPTIEENLNSEGWPAANNSPATNEAKIHYRTKKSDNTGEELNISVFFDKDNSKKVLQSAIDNGDRIYDNNRAEPNANAEVIKDIDFSDQKNKKPSRLADKLLTRKGTVSDSAERFINRGSKDKGDGFER